MKFIYNLIIRLYETLIQLASYLGNPKAGLWKKGREKWQEELINKLADKNPQRIWVHCASLGEFEQGRPLIEKIKKSHPSVCIVLTFFSPSGYEVRKNYSQADLVCYLPLDNSKNAHKFIDLVSPTFAIFIKYEFWYYYYAVLQSKGIPIFSVSSIFRPSQIFFKWYGCFYVEILKKVTRFFVQDEVSKKLLKKIDIPSVDVTGDTRFDRVYEIVKQTDELEKIDQFKAGKKIFVAGSTWEEDEKMIFESLSLDEFPEFKIIIAPHVVSEDRINYIFKCASKYYTANEIVRYSSHGDFSKSRILIIDNIGLLTKIYRYGTIAWVGGGFGKGIHNVLEAAGYGLPVIIGPQYKKFKEAIDLIKLGGVYSVKSSVEIKHIFRNLNSNKDALGKCFAANKEYIEKNKGATGKIYEALLPLLCIQDK